MSFSYYATPTFARVHADPNPYIFIRGPVGSGKSVGAIMDLFMMAMSQSPDAAGIRKTRFGVLRATYPALKSTTIKTWIDWFGPLLRVVYDVPIRAHIEMPHPDGHTTVQSEIYFIALDRAEDISKLQSLELTAAHINEAAEVPREVHTMLKSRCNRYPPEKDGGADRSKILCDYNSPPTGHWLYTLAEEERPEKHSFYRQPSAMLWDGHTYKINQAAENLGHYQAGDPNTPPSKKAIWSAKRNQWFVPHLPADYYPNIVAGSEADYINVFVLNNYGMLRTGKPVYPHYQDSLHCSETQLDALQGVPMLVGMDLGLTPAAAFMQLSPTGQLRVIDELVTEDTSIQKFLSDYLKPVLVNKYPNISYQIIVDPAATFRSPNDKRTAADYIAAAGLPYRTARTNETLARHEAVNYFLLRTGGFLLGPNCTYLRKGMVSEYCYEKLRSSQTERFRETPVKNMYSHVHDALQYGALELSEGRVGRRRPKRTGQYTTRPADAAAGY